MNSIGTMAACRPLCIMTSFYCYQLHCTTRMHLFSVLLFWTNEGSWMLTYQYLHMARIMCKNNRTPYSQDSILLSTVQLFPDMCPKKRTDHESLKSRSFCSNNSTQRLDSDEETQHSFFESEMDFCKEMHPSSVTSWIWL